MVAVRLPFSFFGCINFGCTRLDECKDFWQNGKKAVAFIRPLNGPHTDFIRTLYSHYTAFIRPIYGHYTAFIRLALGISSEGVVVV